MQSTSTYAHPLCLPFSTRGHHSSTHHTAQSPHHQSCPSAMGRTWHYGCRWPKPSTELPRSRDGLSSHTLSTASCQRCSSKTGHQRWYLAITCCVAPHTTRVRPPLIPHAHRQHHLLWVCFTLACWSSRLHYVRRRTQECSSPQCLPSFPKQPS